MPENNEKADAKAQKEAKKAFEKKVAEQKKTEQERQLAARYRNALLIYGGAIARNIRQFLLSGYPEEVRAYAVPREMDIEIGVNFLKDFVKSYDFSGWESKEARAARLSARAEKSRAQKQAAEKRKQDKHAILMKRKKALKKEKRPDTAKK